MPLMHSGQKTDLAALGAFTHCQLGVKSHNLLITYSFWSKTYLPRRSEEHK